MTAFRGDRYQGIPIVAYTVPMDIPTGILVSPDPTTPLDWGVSGRPEGQRLLAKLILDAHLPGIVFDESLIERFRVEVIARLPACFDLSANEIDVFLNQCTSSLPASPVVSGNHPLGEPS